ncbi:MAG: AI-2E family transporter [Rubrivivax sp.]
MNLSPAQRQLLGWLVIGLTGFGLLWLLAPVLTPFLIGAILAYALHPAVERLAARRVPRVLAVLIVEVAMVLALLATLLLILPILSKEIPLLQAQIPLLAERLNQTLTPWLAQQGIHVSLDVPSIKAFVLKYLNANAEEGLAALLSSARIGGSVALAIAGNLVLVPVVLFYLLMDWPRIVARVQALIPQRQAASVNAFLGECDVLLGQYLRGQLLVMLVLAIYYAVGLALFGFDLALPVGVFTGLAIFIPYIGFGLGLALALLAGMLQFASLHALVAVAVVYGVGQVLESFVLTPRLVGERIGLSPLAVIFALLAFGHLFGFVGVLVALPLSAVALVALNRLRAAYLSSRLFTG